MSMNNLNTIRHDWNKELNQARARLNRDIKARALAEMESIRQGKINAYDAKKGGE